MIAGSAEKSGVQLTKPPSRTQRTMRERSPPSAAFACASRLMAHSRAAAVPCSADTVAPSLPLCSGATPCGPNANWPEMTSRWPLITAGT